MNKLFLLKAFTVLLASTSHAAVVTAPAVTVTASAVTVTAQPGVGNSAPANSGSSGSSASGSPPAAAPPAPAAASGSSSSSAPASSSSSSSSPSSSAAPASSGSGPLNITKDEFIKAWTNGKQYLPDANIPPPTDEQYNTFVKDAGPDGGITSKTELAMFMAQSMWESGGFIFKSEQACKTNNCAGSYDNGKGAPGKYYYGRGYIQLTWEYNYAQASKDLYGNDSLYQNPDIVATDEDAAWGVSFWFWKIRVKPKLNGTYNFGISTDVINGGIECRGADPTNAKKRFQIYTEILKVFEPSATPIEAGCYN